MTLDTSPAALSLWAAYICVVLCYSARSRSFATAFGVAGLALALTATALSVRP